MSTLKRNLLIAAIVVITLISAALVVIISHVDSISDPYLNERLIDKATFQGQWAFTAEEGVIRCDTVDASNAISFTILNGGTYALNAPAVIYSKNKSLGWKTLSPQDDVWLNTVNNDPLESDSSKKDKVPLKDTITAGLALCVAN